MHNHLLVIYFSISDDDVLCNPLPEFNYSEENKIVWVFRKWDPQTFPCLVQVEMISLSLVNAFTCRRLI